MKLGKFAKGMQERREIQKLAEVEGKKKEALTEAAKPALKHAQRNKRMDEGNAVKVVRREPKARQGPVGRHHKPLKHFDLLANVEHSVIQSQLNRVYDPNIEQYPKKKRPPANTPQIPPGNFVTRLTKPVGMKEYPTELGIRQKGGKKAKLMINDGLDSMPGLDRLRTLEPTPMENPRRMLYG